MNIPACHASIFQILLNSPNVIPQKLIPSRITRSTANPNVISFRIRKCKTVTYQNSFFNRIARIWNILPECIRMPTSIQSFKLKLLEYYFEALRTSYDPEEPRTWKSICVKCKNARLLNCPVTCCFQSVFVSLCTLLIN